MFWSFYEPTFSIQVLRYIRAALLIIIAEKNDYVFTYFCLLTGLLKKLLIPYEISQSGWT